MNRDLQGCVEINQATTKNKNYNNNIISIKLILYFFVLV